MARKQLFKIIRAAACLTCVFIIAFPVIWMVRTSLIPTVEVYKTPPVIFAKPSLNSYIAVFTRQNFLARFLNSAFISVMTTVLALIGASMAAYGISRFVVPFRKHLPLGFLFLRMLPGMSTLVPMYLLFSKLKLVDTYPGLIMLYTAGAIPMVVWMMWGFYEDLPREIEEAAYVDGCGPFRTFIEVVLPMTTPALAALGILTFTGAWNEFMMATIMTRRAVITLPPGIRFLMSQSDLSWDLISAGGTLASLPIFLFCLFAQRYFVDGLALGAVKG
jgi:ABC-type glycerol-3-phosphate transport system permease component